MAAGDYLPRVIDEGLGVDQSLALVYDGLQRKLHAVDLLDEASLRRRLGGVLLPQLDQTPAVLVFAKDFPHHLPLATQLFVRRHPIVRRDVTDVGLANIMHYSELQHSIGVQIGPFPRK